MQTRFNLGSIVTACLLVAGGCSSGRSDSQGGAKQEAAGEKAPMEIKISSPAFQEGKAIPKSNTCEGEDVSPALRWEGVPDSAKSLALICEDPDAPRGTWIHWVIWGIPAIEHSLPDRVPRSAKLPSGASQGLNDFKEIGYRGPCPPPGGPHRYFFRLFVLDSMPSPPERATAADLRRSMEGHILAEGALMGTYKRGSK
jgi:Raf kinase inhibitor-like YbhB/YbcL family protein